MRGDPAAAQPRGNKSGAYLVRIVEVQFDGQPRPVLDLLLRTGKHASREAGSALVAAGQQAAGAAKAEVRAGAGTHDLLHVLAIRRVPDEILGRGCDERTRATVGQVETASRGAIGDRGGDTRRGIRRTKAHLRAC